MDFWFSHKTINHVRSQMKQILGSRVLGLKSHLKIELAIHGLLEK